jgi:hypothetical protein
LDLGDIALVVALQTFKVLRSWRDESHRTPRDGAGVGTVVKLVGLVLLLGSRLAL